MTTKLVISFFDFLCNMKTLVTTLTVWFAGHGQKTDEDRIVFRRVDEALEVSRFV